MEDFNDIKIFKNTTLADIFQEIHESNRSVDLDIREIIDDLTNKVENISDATILSPIIKDLLDTKVKNNDILVKMAKVIEGMLRRTMSSDSDEDFEMTDAEKKEWESLKNDYEKLHNKN